MATPTEVQIKKHVMARYPKPKERHSFFVADAVHPRVAVAKRAMPVKMQAYEVYL